MNDKASQSTRGLRQPVPRGSQAISCKSMRIIDLASLLLMVCTKAPEAWTWARNTGLHTRFTDSSLSVRDAVRS